jgi:hypothetical protein
LEQGADVIVRTPWKGARWLGKDGIRGQHQAVARSDVGRLHRR